MDQHYESIDPSQIREDYWESERPHDFELEYAAITQYEDLSDDYLTLFNIELHQEYWGDDEGYLLKPEWQEPVIKSSASDTIFNDPLDDYLPGRTWRYNKISEASFVLKPCSYEVGDEIDLEISNTPGEKLHSKAYLKVKVIKLLGQPWRSGCVMVVQCLESPTQSQIGNRYVLKLVDARFLENLRKWNQLGPPTTYTVRRFITMALSGVVDEFLGSFEEEEFKHDADLSVCGRSAWQGEAMLHKVCEVMMEEEISAYERLHDLQGTVIPELIHRVRTCLWSTLAHPPFDVYFSAPGALLECIDGIALSQVPTMPRFFWEEVYREAARVANIFEYYGFEYRSLSPRNIMVKHERGPNGKPRVVFIDLHKHGKWSAKDGFFKYQDRWEHDIEYGLYEDSGHGGLDDEEDVPEEHAEWSKSMFEDHVFTGRFAAQRLFRYRWSRSNHTQALQHALRWRVIMDDLWYVEDRSKAKALLKQNGRISRVACRIMKEEIDRQGVFSEHDRWHARALHRIADALEFDPQEIVSRFDEALEGYCSGPNSQPFTLVETFGDTMLAKQLYPDDESPVSPAVGTAKDTTFESSTTIARSSASSRSTSIDSTASSRTSVFSSSSSAATSVTDLSLVETSTKSQLRIFVPKKKVEQIVEEEEDFGWM